MKYFYLLLLLAGSGLATAADPLRPGIYTGVWMGSPFGVRTSGDVGIGIGTNRLTSLSYATVDPITGSHIARYISARFVSERVLRQNGRHAPALRAVRQGGEDSIRGWFRMDGRRVIFYASYSHPLPPEVD